MSPGYGVVLTQNVGKRGKVAQAAPNQKTPGSGKSSEPLAAPRTCINGCRGHHEKDALLSSRVLPPTSSNHFIMAGTYLDPSFLLSAFGVVAATGVLYCIAAVYRHRSHINQLRKHGMVSLSLFSHTRTPCSDVLECLSTHCDLC